MLEVAKTPWTMYSIIRQAFPISHPRRHITRELWSNAFLKNWKSNSCYFFYASSSKVPQWPNISVNMFNLMFFFLLHRYQKAWRKACLRPRWTLPATSSSSARYSSRCSSLALLKSSEASSSCLQLFTSSGISWKLIELLPVRIYFFYFLLPILATNS